MTVSVIVPVYNVEKYISDCIRSLINQTYKDLEIILVDDGSMDDSGKICEEFAQGDRRIKVLHQTNQGRTSARKLGLGYAFGEYVMFVDSDDWIEINMCEKLIQLAHIYDVDLVTSGYIREEEGRRVEVTDNFAEGLYKTESEREEILLHSMTYGKRDLAGMIFSLCEKLYKREYAQKAMKFIPNNLRRGEDFVFNNIYLMECKSVYISKDIYYYYRNHKDSTVNKPCPDFMWQIGIAQNTLREAIIANHELRNDLKEVLLRSVHRRIFYRFVRMWNQEQKDESDIRIPIYCFDYDRLQADKVVLYGAGRVGIDYYWQFIKTAPTKLVLWVDRNYRQIQTEVYPVCSVEALTTVVFDKIFIAVESEALANEISDSLIKQFQFQKEQIIWQKPSYFWQ